MRKFTRLWKLMMILLLSSSVIYGQQGKTKLTPASLDGGKKLELIQQMELQKVNETSYKAEVTEIGTLGEAGKTSLDTYYSGDQDNQLINKLNYLTAGMSEKEKVEYIQQLFGQNNSDNNVVPKPGGGGTDDISIGTGTVVNQSLPIEPYYGYSYSQVIYLQSEINGNGNITTLSWYFAGTSLTLSNDWTIYMGHTTKATFASTTDWVPVASMTQVWTGTFTSPTGAGWITFDITDFAYNNIDNLVVAVDENLASYNGSADDFRCTAVTGNRAIENHNDVTNPNPASPPAGSLRAYIANIILGGIVPSSPILSVVPNSLSFGYVPSGGTSELSYVLSGINLTAGPIVVTAPSGFEVSLTSGSGFAGSVNVTYTPPTLGNTTIYVRFAPSGPPALYTGNVTNAGGGATTQNVAVTGTSNFYSQYCASGASSTGDEDITMVQFGSTLNNTTPCASLVGTQGTGTGTADLYSSFTTSIPATDVSQGVTAPISVQITECLGSAYSHDVRVYIDFNKNGLLTDAGEEFIIWPYASSNTHTINANIAIPASASLGNTLMRVVCKESSSTGPCLVSSWGETEDYVVNITVATTPSLSAVPGTLNFGYVVAGGTSAELTYVLTGVALSPASGNIAVTAPTDFKVSLTTGGPYTANVSVPYTGGALAGTTIYAIFQPPTANLNYTGNITNVGGGASVDVAVSGTTLLQYCTANLGGSGSCPGDITVVDVNSLNNTAHTNCVVANGSTYGNYPPVGSNTTSLGKGLTYSLSVTTNESCIESVWFDFNQNGTFETTEWWQITTSSVVNVPSAVSITIPGTALDGLTAMRIRSRLAGNTNGAGDACSNFGSGICEDYYVTIQVPTNPYLSAIPGSLNFGSVVAGGTSAEFSYVLTGGNLVPASGNITITPPALFEVSSTTGGPYSSSPILVAYSGGTVSATVFAVFKPTAGGSFSGTITNVTGSASANVSVSGSSPTPGDNCLNPIVVNLPAALPYGDLGQTTCGRGDDYNATCMGNYDGGEDIIYQINVTSATNVNITLDPKTSTWTGFSVFDLCPADPLAVCLYSKTNSGASVYTLTGAALAAGTYYIMVDTWPSPPCITLFDLTITEAAPPPVNDDCLNAIVVGGSGYPVTTTGTTVGATASCPTLFPLSQMPSGEVWYGITLPNAYNNVVIDYCGDALMDNGWVEATLIQCSCTGTDYLVATSWTFLAPCVTALTWENVPGPGIFYYPVATGTVQEGFTITFNVYGPSVATINPTSFEKGVNPGSTATDNLAIGNTGPFKLTYTATVANYTDAVILNESFEGTFPPTGWSNINNGGTCVWDLNTNNGNTNYAGGNGQCADADADACGSGTTMNTELITPSFSLAGGYLSASLSFIAAYSDITTGVGTDLATVDISINGGTSWANLLTWDEDHSASGPGENAAVDLTPYLGNTDCKVRFVYFAPGWDWWFMVDNVKIEGFTTPTGWLTLDGGSSVTGSVLVGAPANTIVVGYNATTLPVGTYHADIVITTSEPGAKLTHTVPVTLKVGYRVYGNLYYGDQGTTKPFETLTTVSLYQGVTLIATRPTGVGGYFEFVGLPAGNYKLYGTTTKPLGTGAIQAFDASMIAKFGGGAITLSNLQKRAGDVNKSLTSSPNAFDATQIKKRLASGTKPAVWTAPDFVFDGPFTAPALDGLLVPVTTSDVNVIFRSLCSGDLNGSRVWP